MDKHGVRPDLDAVQAVLTRTNTQLMSFLGIVQYYRDFLRRYAEKVYPMQQLTCNKGKKMK